VTNSRHKGKREPLGREESKPESASLPAEVSRMCVFPAPNSARLGRNFPLFRLIPGYLRLFTPIYSCLQLFTPDPVKIFSHQPARSQPQRGARAPACRQAGPRVHRSAPACRQAGLADRPLRLLAPTCSHLRLFPMKIFSHERATLPFLAKTVPKSSTTPKKIITFNNF
jgi:hypothetical protein